MQPIILFLLVLTSMQPLWATAQTTLNKCIDADGKVTYSNLPCRNAKAVRTLEVDPAPTPSPQASPTRAAPVAPSAVTPVVPSPAALPAPVVQPAPSKPAASKAPVLSIEPGSKYIDAPPSAVKQAPSPSAGQCDALTERLGRIFDKMDAARRLGATPEEMKIWNEEVKELEQKKQQSGCF